MAFLQKQDSFLEKKQKKNTALRCLQKVCCKHCKTVSNLFCEQRDAARVKLCKLYRQIGNLLRLV